MHYSQFKEDHLIEEFISKNKIELFPNIFEIGAAEVSRNSNSRFFIESKGFKAYLFEPNPEFNAKLKAHYAENKKVTVEKFAISDVDGEVSFDLQEDYTLSGISSSGNLKIQSKRLKTYLEENGLSSDIGILSIDTEGYDSVILRSILEDGLRPQIVLIENSGNKELKIQKELLLEDYGCIFSTGRGQWATKNLVFKAIRKVFNTLGVTMPLRPVNTIWIRKDLLAN